MEENIGTEHYELLSNCDVDLDGLVSDCEVFDCLVFTENEWRDLNCPEAEHVYCDCPWYEPPTFDCSLPWNCDVANARTYNYLA